MEYVRYVRKPFVVEATLVTEENLEEIANLVGQLREDPKTGKKFIQVNKNVVPAVNRVHPGYWMTRMGDNIRCYNKRVFAQQFTLSTEEIENWVNYIRDEQPEEEVAVLEGAVSGPGGELEMKPAEPTYEVVTNGGNA